MSGGAREVKVFVSSTFRDMRADRDELARHTFPRLRTLCAERAVTFTDVDLRWGVTDEAAAEGGVLRVCLEEITRCRPFFIGLLGERYGWIPDSIPSELRETQPWLVDSDDKSITELEILHGVLRNPEMASKAYFYFRDPAYAHRRGADYVSTDSEAREKLANLKAGIRASDLPVREGYPDPVRLGELVYDDVAAAIEELFPADTVPDALARERLLHDAFSATKRRAYVQRPELSESLDEWAGKGQWPLTVVGAAGSGKSALLANWAAGYQEVHQDAVVVTHFAGASADSTSWRETAKRLYGELASRSGVDLGLPIDAVDLSRLLAVTFNAIAAEGGQALVVIDGLDRIQDPESCSGLSWLPRTLPDGVLLVVSMTPGELFDQAKKLRWPYLEVGSLGIQARERLIDQHLAQHRKELPRDRVGRIARAPQCESPLHLTLLLDELCLWGEHETLHTAIDHYLEASSTADLLERVLDRLEQDYDRDREQLVADTMRLLRSARHGLSETELLELLGEGDRLPRAYLSPLLLAIERLLLTASGLLRLEQQIVGAVVDRRYLGTDEQRRETHRKLAAYYRSRLSKPAQDRRALEGALWHMAQAEDWNDLGELLADPDTFTDAWDEDRFAVRAYWGRLERESDWRAADVYGETLAEPSRHSTYLSAVSELLSGLGHKRVALKLIEGRAQALEEGQDDRQLHLAMGDRAEILIELGQCDEAASVLAEQQALGLEQAGPREAARYLHHQAMINEARGQLDEALEHLEREEALTRESGDEYACAYSLAGQSGIFRGKAAQTGDYSLLSRAESLTREQERLSRKMGDLDGVAHALGARATVRFALGDTELAERLFAEAISVYRESGNKLLLADCLNTRSFLSRELGRHERALEELEESESVSREVGSPSLLAASLRLQADVLRHIGRISEASRKADEAAALTEGS